MAAASPARVALVVGATAGIGRAVALRLADADFRVLVVGRDAARGAEVVADCATRGARRGGHEFLPCDASRIGAVRALAADVSARFPSLDALVLSQGIASVAGRTETPEGLDVKLSLHYFSRVEFIRRLLPQLRASPDARVLSVLSAGVHGVYPHYADDFELKRNYSLKNAADAAGLYNDAALDALSRDPENTRITFVHAAPGFVATSWGTELPWAARMLVRGLQAFATPAEKCGDVLVRAMLAPRATPSEGFVLVGAKGEAAKRTPAHEAMRDAVWRSTLQVLDGIK